MRELRVSRDTHHNLALPNVHVVRYNGVVHIAYSTQGPPVVLLYPDGTPAGDGFRMDTRCGKTVKMYCGGQNRITDNHPTCVLCIVAELNSKDFT